MLNRHLVLPIALLAFLALVSPLQAQGVDPNDVKAILASAKDIQDALAKPATPAPVEKVYTIMDPGAATRISKFLSDYYGGAQNKFAALDKVLYVKVSSDLVPQIEKIVKSYKAPQPVWLFSVKGLKSGVLEKALQKISESNKNIVVVAIATGKGGSVAVIGESTDLDAIAAVAGKLYAPNLAIDKR